MTSTNIKRALNELKAKRKIENYISNDDSTLKLIKDINFDEGEENTFPKSSKKVIEASRHSPLIGQGFINKD